VTILGKGEGPFSIKERLMENVQKIWKMFSFRRVFEERSVINVRDGSRK